MHIDSPLTTKFTLGGQTVIFICALLYATILNLAFYHKIALLDEPARIPSWTTLCTLPLVIFLFLTFCFEILLLPHFHRILMPLLFVLSSMVSYYTYTADMYFTTNMFENLLATNWYESTRMITLPYIVWIVVFGVLPAVLYLYIPVRFSTFKRELVRRSIVITFCLICVGGMGRFLYLDYASFFRNNPKIHFMVVPYNFIASGVGIIRRATAKAEPYVTLGEGMVRHKSSPQRKAVVLIIGETTRAQNFGLNGYSRQTTPKLAARNDLIYVPNVRSCGTSTAISVPCMLSDLNSSDFNHKAIGRRDSLVHVLMRTGVKVTWLDNNSNCHGACNGLKIEEYLGKNEPKLCTDGECLDEIMLPAFKQALAATDEKDQLIVLHVMGNHGPSYHERYSAEFRRFTPTCDTNNISACTPEQLVNTYDNGILYQDHFMNEVLNILSAQADIATACYFVSDHGESLGEKGMYLHGTPKALAPDEQVLVPMFLWFSPLWLKTERLDPGCVRARATLGEISHDELFSTVLGLFDTGKGERFYQAQRDLCSDCKTQP